MKEQEQKEPIDCKMEYDEKICGECQWLDFIMVSHPGGSSYHQVEKHHCELGYWQEDF